MRLGIAMRAPRKGENLHPPTTDLIADQFDVIVAAASGWDLIVAVGLHQYAARSASEVHSIPCRPVVFAPNSIPSRTLAPGADFEFELSLSEVQQAWYRQRTAWNERTIERLNANRSKWKLPSVPDVLNHIIGPDVLLAADPLLAPASRDGGIAISQTGAWFKPDVRDLPRDLSQFLDAGEPPVFIGFGSMPVAHEAMDMLIAAVLQLGCRAVVATGWSNYDTQAKMPDVMTVSEVNQQKLFERAAVIIHHGGAGTTFDAARAGIPQYILPLYSDQFYWAKSITSLGIGTSASYASVTTDAVSSALEFTALQSAAPAANVAKRLKLDGTQAALKELLSAT